MQFGIRLERKTSQSSQITKYYKEKDMRRNIKAQFIQEHGQEAWELVNDYINHGNRCSEATEAMKHYNRLQKGLTDSVWTTYGIYDLNDNLLYVGSTSTTLKSRWTSHKTHARNLHRASAIHYHMYDTMAQYGGDVTDWFECRPIEQFDNAKAAEDHELLLIDTFHPPYNLQRGGGNKGKLKRPLPQPDDLQTR